MFGHAVQISMSQIPALNMTKSQTYDSADHITTIEEAGDEEL
jgi:hypothetical protein